MTGLQPFSNATGKIVFEGLLHLLSWMSFKFKRCTNRVPWGITQTIAYEVTLAVILLSVLQINGSFTLSVLIITQEHLWLTFPPWHLTIIWVIFILTEIFWFDRKWIGICTHRIHGRLIHGVPGRECQHHHKKRLLFLGAFHNPYIYEVYKDNLIIKTLLLIISFLRILTPYPWFWYD